MAKLMGQWKQLADNTVILRRRWFLFKWSFFKFETFRNHIYRLDEKMNKKAKELQELYDKRQELVRKERRILKDIKRSRESDAYVTAPARHEFPLFKFYISDIPKPQQDWDRFEDVLESGKRTIAGDFATIHGAKILSPGAVEYQDLDKEEEFNEEYSTEQLGTKEHGIHHYNKNQKGQKQKNQQNQQNQQQN